MLVLGSLPALQSTQSHGNGVDGVNGVMGGLRVSTVHWDAHSCVSGEGLGRGGVTCRLVSLFQLDIIVAILTLLLGSVSLHTPGVVWNVH